MNYSASHGAKEDSEEGFGALPDEKTPAVSSDTAGVCLAMPELLRYKGNPSIGFAP